MNLHLQIIELSSDDAVWRSAGLPIDTAGRFRATCARQLTPNILINWADRMMHFNENVWTAIQRLDATGMLSRISFGQFVAAVSPCVHVYVCSKSFFTYALTGRRYEKFVVFKRRAASRRQDYFDE